MSWPGAGAATRRRAISSEAPDRLTKPGFDAEPAANVMELRSKAIVPSGKIARPTAGGCPVLCDGPAGTANRSEGAEWLIVGKVGALPCDVPIEAPP